MLQFKVWMTEVRMTIVESGWNLWMWLECIGVVSGCRKEVYRFPHNNLLFPTPLVLALSSIPTSLFILKMFFVLLLIVLGAHGGSANLE